MRFCLQSYIQSTSVSFVNATINTSSTASSTAIISNAAKAREALQAFVDAFRDMPNTLGIESNNILVGKFTDAVNDIKALIDKVCPTSIVLDWPDMAVTKRDPILTWGSKVIPLDEWEMPRLGEDIVFAGRRWRNEDYYITEGKNWFYPIEE